MTGRDEAFRKGQRVSARIEGEFARSIERTRDSPDEILELVNFAVGVGQIEGDASRLALRFILPNGRQYIAKITPDNAVSLAASIQQTVEIMGVPTIVTDAVDLSSSDGSG